MLLLCCDFEIHEQRSFIFFHWFSTFLFLVLILIGFFSFFSIKTKTCCYLFFRAAMITKTLIHQRIISIFLSICCFLNYPKVWMQKMCAREANSTLFDCIIRRLKRFVCGPSDFDCNRFDARLRVHQLIENGHSKAPYGSICQRHRVLGYL